MRLAPPGALMWFQQLQTIYTPLSHHATFIFLSSLKLLLPIYPMLLILPLTLRSESESLPLSEWLSITTLCLAPLIVHIIAGVPDTVYLQPDPPRWHDLMCFFNPTTIIWRYLALADRRIRSKEWKAVDMAASNVEF